MKKEKPKHSNLGASSAYRWMECPGSVALIAANPQLKKSSVYADEGTAAHELAEILLTAASSSAMGENYIYRTYLGMMLGPDKNIEVTESMLEAVLVYFYEIQDQLRSSQHQEVFIESAIDLTFIGEGMYGTNDAIIVRPFDRLIVYDYKHGAGVPVEVENNPQLMYYALGAAAKYNFDFVDVEIVVVQPRCIHHDGPIRRHVIPMAELLAFGEVLKAAAKKTKENNAAIKAGKWCRFCDVKPICPQLRKQSVEIAVNDFEDLDKPVLREPALMTSAEIAKVLNAAQMVATWVDAVKEYAHQAAEKGQMIPGYKLVKKRAHRQWSDATQIETIALKNGFKHNDLYSYKFKSPAQLEKLIGKEIVAKYTYSPEGGFSLVQESNSKPAIDINPDFGAID